MVVIENDIAGAVTAHGKSPGNVAVCVCPQETG
jgi:hypothetical protein